MTEVAQYLAEHAVTPTITETVTPVSNFDKCDGCGFQAYVRAVKKRPRGRFGFELLFCGHHAAEHIPALLATGWTVDADQRADLLKRDNDVPAEVSHGATAEVH